MRGKKPGSLSRFTCSSCGKKELAKGGTSGFLCAECKPADHHTQTAQYQAHLAVARARRAGTIEDPRGLTCVDCGGPAIEYDHRDYAKPLEVQAVCRRCNLLRGPALGSKSQPAPLAERP